MPPRPDSFGLANPQPSTNTRAPPRADLVEPSLRAANGAGRRRCSRATSSEKLSWRLGLAGARANLSTPTVAPAPMSLSAYDRWRPDTTVNGCSNLTSLGLVPRQCAAVTTTRGAITPAPHRLPRLPE